MRKLFGLLVLVLLVLDGTQFTQGQTTYNVKVLNDLTYYEGPGFNVVKHKLDLYLPEGLKNAPVIVYVHGGSWQEGDKRAQAQRGQNFARLGFATVVTNYRLTPEVMHPGHIEDIARAFAWVHKNIAQYDGDVTKIFVMGHSAGGHLTALLTLNERFLQAHNLSRKAIRGAIPISGLYDITAPGLFNSVFGTNPEKRRDASPIEHIGPEMPPFLLLCAQFDHPGLCFDAQRVQYQLRQQRSRADYAEIPATNHSTIIDNLGQLGDPATEAILKFLRAL